jgi:adenylate cyclase
LSSLENDTVDARFSLRGGSVVDEPFCLVTIDDASLARRDLVLDHRVGIAALLRALRAAGTKAVAVDALFTGEERVLSPRLVEDIDAWLAQPASPTESAEVTAALAQPRALLSHVRDEARGDDVLRGAIAGGDVVLAAHTGSAVGVDVVGVDLTKASYGQIVPGPSMPPAAHRVVTSLPAFDAAAARMGLLTLVVDVDDHTARTVHAGRTIGQTVLMPFGVALAAAARGVSRGQLAYDAAGHALHIDDRVFFTDDAHRLWLNHRGGTDAFCKVSAVDVVDGKAGDRLRGRVAVVGYTELGQDTVATPYAPQLPGAALHVTLASNLLRGDLLTRAPQGVDVVVAVAFGALGALFFSSRIRARAGLRVGLAFALAVGWLVVAQLLFVRAFVVVPIVAPLLCLATATAAGVIASWGVEGVQRARLRRAFAHYLSNDVIEELLHNPQALSPGGERRPLTVLFSDIRGFTTLSEELDPLALVRLLNTYFTPMTAAVLEHRGLLDKYIGDAVMAVFGAPVPNPHHVDDALTCAITMHERLTALQGNEAFLGRRLEIGVGLNTGEMVVGNMGGADRFDYTVVGDAVNLASRIEGLTRAYGAFCLVGESTRRAASPRFRFREVDAVRVKGKRQPVAIYELLGDERVEVVRYVDVAGWERGLAAYRAGRFDEARAALARCAEANPHDVVGRLLLGRMDALGAPPVGWDGVYEHATK